MLRKRITPSLALSVVAVVLASAGTSVATVKITGKQVKDGSLTGADVRNRSLTGADVKDHSLTAADIRRGGVTRAAIASSTAQELQATVATTKVSRSEPIVLSDGTYHPSSVDVSCPTGQVALGGGGGFTRRPDIGSLGANRPIVDATTGDATGWIVGGKPGTLNDETLEVYVICAPAP